MDPWDYLAMLMLGYKVMYSVLNKSLMQKLEEEQSFELVGIRSTEMEHLEL